MKTKTSFVTLLFALLLVFSFSVEVSASPVPNNGHEISAISRDENSAPVSDTPESTDEYPPTVQGEALGGPETPEGAELAAEAQAAPAPQKSNNTPFFVGAGIAVLLFIGVALYCKANGNKSL